MNAIGLAQYKLCTVKQEPYKTVNSFLEKVRILVKECKHTNPDEHIIDALIFGSNNSHVQSKLLKHDDTLTKQLTSQEPVTGFQGQSGYSSRCSEVWSIQRTTFRTGEPG